VLALAQHGSLISRECGTFVKQGRDLSVELGSGEGAHLKVRGENGRSRANKQMALRKAAQAQLQEQSCECRSNQGYSPDQVQIEPHLPQQAET